MFCPKCQAVVDPNYRYCQKCGAKRENNTNNETTSGKPQDFEDLSRRAEAGEAQAQAELGKAYYRGTKPIIKDVNKARMYFEKAAAQDNALGFWGMAVLYWNGKGGFPKDQNKAYQLGVKSANRGCVEGIGFLGVCYQNGTCVAQNDAEACRLYRIAADKGYAVAQRNLGWMYAHGRGVPQNDVEACRLYRLAADQGNADAHCNLGWMYANGRGVVKNPMAALELYNRAVIADSENLEYRANFYQDIGRYDDAIMDLFEFYKQHEIVKEALSEKYSDLAEINYGHLKYILPGIIAKGEHFIFYTCCDFVFDDREEQSMYSGNSYMHYYGSYGSGYIALTDKSIYMYASHGMSVKYPAIKKSALRFLSRSSDHRKVVHTDYSLEISYDSIINCSPDNDGNLIIQTGIKTSAYPISEKMTFAGIKLGMKNKFEIVQNDHSKGTDKGTEFVTKLKQLKELHDTGILSEIEYEEKKKKILSEMGL